MNKICLGASGDDSNVILHLACCFHFGELVGKALKVDCVGFLLCACMTLLITNNVNIINIIILILLILEGM